MLILSRKSGEALIINEEIEIKIIEVNGDKVKIGINAPQNVKILRSELRQTVESNKDAVSGVNQMCIRDRYRTYCKKRSR